MNNDQQLGVSWTPGAVSKAVEQELRLQQSGAPRGLFIAAPFTGLYSVPGPGRVHPLVCHTPAVTLPHLQNERTTGPFDQARVAQANTLYAQKIQELSEHWGPSSSFAINHQALTDATDNLVKGVIEGNPVLVEQSLRQGADPNMLIPVLDTTRQDGFYVLMPIGVAAALRGKEVVDKTGNKEDLIPFQAIARHLLLTPAGQSKVAIGTAPDTGLHALGYTMPSLTNEGSFCQRNVPLSMWASNALAKSVPEAMDKPVRANSDDVGIGERVVREEQSALGMVDVDAVALAHQVDQYQQRQARFTVPLKGAKDIALPTLSKDALQARRTVVKPSAPVPAKPKP